MRFIFVHEGKSEDTIKGFLNESYEYYVKVRDNVVMTQALMNPFVDKNTRLFSPSFDSKIKLLAKKHFL
jgi:hypothetical protein